VVGEDRAAQAPDDARAADAPFVATVEGQRCPGDPDRLSHPQPVGRGGEEGGEVLGGELRPRRAGKRRLGVGRQPQGLFLGA
jgi:hypothetical protein